MDPPTTTALVAAALEGDREAWERIVDRYDRLVWSVVRGFRLGDASSADVAQTVWLRLVENLERVRDPERLAAWLATTARNEALRAMRSRQQVIPTDLDDAIPDPSAHGFDEDMIHDQQLTELAEAMRRVSADCLQLLRLLATDPPIDYETIAELIGRPKGSIGPTRARCISKLRRIMERRGDGDDRPGPLPEGGR